MPERTAVSPAVSGGLTWPPMRWKSVIARPTQLWGTSKVKAYQGSSSTLSASISPWRTAR